MAQGTDAMTGICAGCGELMMETSLDDCGLCTQCHRQLMHQELSYSIEPEPIDMEDAMTIDSQKQKVLRHLEMFGSIDPVQALQEYGIFRLAARIDELRREAYEIETHLVKTINRFGEDVRYGRYVLASRQA
jgi:hypothetical protein